MRIGIDLGGTKTEIVVLDKAGNIAYKKRVPSPQNSYQGTLNCIVTLVENATHETNITKVDSIGIGTPGTVSKQTGLIKNCNSTWLNNQPMHKDLEKILNCKVFIANDANCMALSEACDGSAANHDIVFAVILGTGCGAGLALYKHVHSGINGVSGEWGHNPLPWMDDEEYKFAKTLQCYCGQHGCIEHFLSGTGFAKYYNYLNDYKTTLRSHEIFELADKGDELATKCTHLYETRLAKSLAHIINVLDPDIIVAAGGMSNIARIYPNVNKLMHNWVLGNECKTKVVQSTHGDSSGVRGAAWLNDIK
ncbi:MAG: ROK family protein [Burkholderiales bacterium]|nr:ROK family protein [Burkholderiales bacterium]